MVLRIITEYPDGYEDVCFYAWYKAGRPHFQSSYGSHVRKIFPPAPDGRKPTKETIRKWMNEHGWMERADALDAEVSRRLDKDAIEARIKVLKELASVGEKLADKGMEYILTTENPFKDNPSAAVRAVRDGVEMRFKYAGMADVLANIGQMNDNQVQREILRLLGKSENENTIDVEAENIEDLPDDDTESDNT